MVARGALEWGPVKRADPVVDDAVVSAARTSSSTVRRVGLEGRQREAAA
jgi:hypothetical protein